MMSQTETAKIVRKLSSEQWSERRVVVLFEYIGNSELNVHGLVTGKQYTFARHGAVAEVDPRDRNLFLAMPSLRQL
jgi:hypothetical protein